MESMYEAATHPEMRGVCIAECGMSAKYLWSQVYCMRAWLWSVEVIV